MLPRKPKAIEPEGGVQTVVLRTLGVKAGPLSIYSDDVDAEGRNIWIRHAKAYAAASFLINQEELKLLRAVIDTALNHLEMSR